MISCKAVADLLLSDRLATEKRLSRVEVRLHLAMRGIFSRFARRVEQLRSGARHFRSENKGDADLEERLIQRLFR